MPALDQDEAHGVSTNEYEQAFLMRHVAEQKLVALERRKIAVRKTEAGRVLIPIYIIRRGKVRADNCVRIEKGESKVATKTLKKQAVPAKPAKVVALKVPDFGSESEEADWWYAHRDLVEDLLEKHGRRAGKGFDLEVELVKPTTKAISIRLAEPDIQRAKALAARKGVGYQTYIRSVLHEALQQKA